MFRLELKLANLHAAEFHDSGAVLQTDRAGFQVLGVVTANGLLFIGSSDFDTKTGKMIWEMSLPFPGTASPATYMVNGSQYIAFSTSSGRAPKLKEKGSILVAYALPQ